MADLGRVLSEATAYGDDREAEGRAAAEVEAAERIAELNAAMTVLRAERDTAVAALANHMAEPHYPPPDPDPDPDPDPPAKTWLLGMSTEPSQWDLRASQVGRPVNVRRRFRASWSVDGLVQLARDCHDVGAFPYVSAKMSPSSWAQVAGGALDRDAETLGNRLADLGYPVRVTFHHEPRPATVVELVVWGQALTRLFTRMRAGAGTNASRLILGPTDNGFPWGDGWKGGVTPADLGRYYTDAFLAACDVLGADFYDGATATNPGEPAWVKMRNFAAYFDGRGFTGVNDPGWKYDCGEWNFVEAKDCDDTWAFLTSPAGKDFNLLSLFNSAANNRTDLPDVLNGSWVLVEGTARMAAFRRMLDAAAVKPTTTQEN